MLSFALPALRMLAVLTAFTGVLYPLLVTGLAAVFFPGRSTGSLVFRAGAPVGSALIGQQFRDPGHFWSRPSAAGYDATASGGSNLAPSNPALVVAVRERIAALRAADPNNLAPVPVDLVTASASGLDPHISQAAAEYQVARIARARGLDERLVRATVAAHTLPRQLGVLGEPRVEVLALNLALDGLR
jgi:K+-transporting ATPase ATPase C chain